MVITLITKKYSIINTTTTYLVCLSPRSPLRRAADQFFSQHPIIYRPTHRKNRPPPVACLPFQLLPFQRSTEDRFTKRVRTWSKWTRKLLRSGLASAAEDEEIALKRGPKLHLKHPKRVETRFFFTSNGQFSPDTDTHFGPKKPKIS